MGIRIDLSAQMGKQWVAKSVSLIKIINSYLALPEYMFTPVGIVVGVLLLIRLCSFFPKVVEFANVNLSEPSNLQPPKGFFAKRKHKKQVEKAEEDYIVKKFLIYIQYFFCLIAIFFCSSIGGYSLMIPVAMLIATAFNQELFPAKTPIIGKDQTSYLQIRMRYAQANLHLIIGADGFYNQKLVRKYYLRKYFFLYRWFTKKTQALVDLENSIKNDHDVVKDFIKGFFVSFFKLTILLVPLDILIGSITGNQSSSYEEKIMPLFCSCFFGIFGVIAGTSLMRKSVATESKVTLQKGGNIGTLSTSQNLPFSPPRQTTGVLPASPPPPAVMPAPPASMNPALPPAPPIPVVPASPPPPAVMPAPPASMNPALPPAPPTPSVTSKLPKPAVSDMPPLPPGGLPSGWTIEQWKHYGKEWYQRQNM